MTTALTKKVERDTGLTVDGRQVLAALDRFNDEPVLVLRTKGRRKSWVIRISQLMDHLQHFEPTGEPMKLKEPDYAEKTGAETEK